MHCYGRRPACKAAPRERCCQRSKRPHRMMCPCRRGPPPLICPYSPTQAEINNASRKLAYRTSALQLLRKGRSCRPSFFCSISSSISPAWCASGGLLDLIDRLCTHVKGSCRWCFDAAFRAKVRAVAPQRDAEHKELDEMVLAMLPRDAWCPSCAQLETLLRDAARPRDAGGEGGGGRKKARRGGRKTKAARAAAGADNTHAAGQESRASSQASSLDAHDVRSHARGGHQGCPSSNDGAEAGERERNSSAV